MTSVFTWLDYSETERRKALEVIDLFRDRETRDELGIGTVRDALADRLFPGTSTIQTRAKYFLFIPWIYRELERLRVPSAYIAQRARSEEVRLIEALLRGGETEGVIGRDVGRNLQRLPSDIYWLGMQTFGIRKFNGSRDQLHRRIDRFYHWSERGNADLMTEEGSPVDGIAVNWDPHLPPMPPDMRTTASLRLSNAEASYLKERIVAHAPGTLLGYLLEGDIFDQVDFPWQLSFLEDLPRPLQEQLHHARNFSLCIHGAALLYNLMLAEKRLNAGLEAQYFAALADWADRITHFEADLMAWSRDAFWRTVEASAQVPFRTRAFIDRWLDLVLDDETPRSNAADIASSQTARHLISTREVQLKGARARLYNQRALENWSGAAGAQALNYRWTQAQRIIRDILTGLSGDEALPDA